jgi:antitoxin component YwqK of YwqJK toxin-antitoxin module
MTYSQKTGKTSEDWIEENRPENGLFRAYWYNYTGDDPGEPTLDPDKGDGLRYEWEYKDGKRADGVTKGWWPNGELKHTWTYKDGKKNGVSTEYFDNGQKRREGSHKDDERDGFWTVWYENGQKWREGYWKDGARDGKWTFWSPDGQESG